MDLLRNPADTNSKKVEWTIGKASAAAICEMDIFCDNAAKFVITKFMTNIDALLQKKYLTRNKNIYCETIFFDTAEMFTLKLIFVNYCLKKDINVQSNTVIFVLHFWHEVQLKL